MSEEFTVKITEKKFLDYTQSQIIQRRITLLKGNEIIFEDKPVFVAHSRMYQLGLSKLAKQNLI